MLYLPPLRRLLFPSLIILAIVLYYRSPSSVQLQATRQQLSRIIIRQPELSEPGYSVPVASLDYKQIILANQAENYKSPPTRLYYPYLEPGATYNNGTEIHLSYPDPASNPYLQPLFECPFTPNPITDHIRLPNPLYNVSLMVNNDTDNERKGFLNPAIISLPSWSENQYLVVSRVQTDGSHQLNLLCEANICYTDKEQARRGEKPCGDRDLELLGGTIGMRCATAPMTLNVPPTPARSCPPEALIMTDLPGFHDPRVFWTGKGEPLMMVNTQSRYSCFGLWVIDLRQLHKPLDGILNKNPVNPRMLSPLMSYPTLTELTRNPPSTRGAVEKNWMFFGNHDASYIHYDIGPQKRAFAKLLGGGLTTVNLTDPREQPCLEQTDPKEGSWHQGTNSLLLTLCDRSDPNCKPLPENQVYFSLIHHKHKSIFGIPLRYERYLIVWSALPPFGMLGVSRYPMQMYNETAGGFEPEENWIDDTEQKSLRNSLKSSKENWALFTYTVSISWAWGRKDDGPQDKSMGYLDDEVMLGVGVDDASMVFARVQARTLLSCLRACPPRSDTPLSSGETTTEDEFLTEHGWDKEKEGEEGEVEMEIIEGEGMVDPPLDEKTPAGEALEEVARPGTAESAAVNDERERSGANIPTEKEAIAAAEKLAKERDEATTDGERMAKEEAEVLKEQANEKVKEI